MLNITLYPLRYLWLRDEQNRLVLRRDLRSVVLSAIISAGLYFLLPEGNFFSKDGLVEHVGTLSSTLSGFYIAGLVAVATFAASLSDLDKPLEIGPVFIFDTSIYQSIKLTRREYVCIMFGYLSFLSLSIALSSIILTFLSDPLSKINFRSSCYNFSLVRTGISAFSFTVFTCAAVHLFVTTTHGLYYLMDRIYAVSPKLKPLQNDWDEPDHQRIDPSQDGRSSKNDSDVR